MIAELDNVRIDGFALFASTTTNRLGNAPFIVELEHRANRDEHENGAAHGGQAQHLVREGSASAYERLIGYDSSPTGY